MSSTWPPQTVARYLPEPVLAASHAECLHALHAAQSELLSLVAECGLPLIDLTLVRTQVASARTEVDSLPR